MGKSRTVTLLFAHGCGFSKEMWTPVIRRVKESAAAQRVKTEFVTFDFPFHGSRRDVKLAETLTVDLSDRKTPRVRGDCEDLREWYLSAMGEQVASMGECDVLIGVGFSMGAGALWAMEIAHPGTFDALVLFEPTLDTRTPRTTAMCSYLVALTLRRPSSWPSRAVAEEYFRSADVYAAWDDEAMAAYLSGSLVDQDDGSVSLACDPRLEASLYSMQPLHFSDQELQQPTCPIRLHWADRSKMCFVDMFRAIESKAPTIYTVRDAMPGLGHLVVMEKPSLTAERVLQELQQLEPYAQAAARL